MEFPWCSYKVKSLDHSHTELRDKVRTSPVLGDVHLAPGIARERDQPAAGSSGEDDGLEKAWGEMEEGSVW